MARARGRVVTKPSRPMIIPGARAPLCARKVCAPCSSGAVGIVGAPDKHVRAVEMYGAVDPGESCPPHVEGLEHVLASAGLETGASAVSPSASTIMTTRARCSTPRSCLGPRITIDDSTKRHLMKMSYTRSRSERRSRRGTSESVLFSSRRERVKKRDPRAAWSAIRRIRFVNSMNSQDFASLTRG